MGSKEQRVLNVGSKQQQRVLNVSSKEQRVLNVGFVRAGLRMVGVMVESELDRIHESTKKVLSGWGRRLGVRRGWERGGGTTADHICHWDTHISRAACLQHMLTAARCSKSPACFPKNEASVHVASVPLI